MSRYFGKATHVGYVVPNVQREIERMLTSGVGPFFLLDHVQVASRHRGKRADLQLTAAICYSGGIQCEFIEQHDETPSVYHEYLARRPEGGLHHLAYDCTGLEDVVRNAETLSGTRFDIVQEFLAPDGSAFEIYVEPTNQANPLLMQLALPSPLSAVYGEIERIAAAWDGREPVRNFFSLMPADLLPPVS